LIALPLGITMTQVTLLRFRYRVVGKRLRKTRVSWSLHPCYSLRVMDTGELQGRMLLPRLTTI